MLSRRREPTQGGKQPQKLQVPKSQLFKPGYDMSGDQLFRKNW